jgi:hypothetical protein
MAVGALVDCLEIHESLEDLSLYRRVDWLVYWSNMATSQFFVWKLPTGNDHLLWMSRFLPLCIPPTTKLWILISSVSLESHLYTRPPPLHAASTGTSHPPSGRSSWNPLHYPTMYRGGLIWLSLKSDSNIQSRCQDRKSQVNMWNLSVSRWQARDICSGCRAFM